MKYHKAQYHLRGLTPLLMHNGQLSDPLSEWTKSLAKVTGKKGKTDSDHIETARIEFLGGLYLSNGVPCIPPEMIESMLLGAGKKRRRGPDVKAGIICENPMPLLYEGPTSTKELWESGQFRLTTGVRVSGKRIQRTRPMFKDWSLDVEIHYLDDVWNKADIDQLFKIAGISIGLGDWRPKFGRFEVAE